MTRISLNRSFRGLTRSRVAGVVAAVALLMGRSGGAVMMVPLSAASSAAVAVEKRAVDERTVAHVLNRMAFGPAPGDIERVRAMGVARYIDEQLAPRKADDAAMRERLAKFETLKMTSREIGERFASLEELRRELQLRQPAGARPGQPPGDMNDMAGASQPGALQPDASQPGASQAGASQPGARQPGSEQQPGADMQRPGAPERAERDELLANLTPEQRQRVMELRKQNQQVLGDMSEQKLLRAVYSDRQLEEVLVDFWFNHFNVFAGKGATRIYLTEYERDAIRPHVLGSFRDLLGATAHSPAMLFYLDNWQSSDPDASAARGQMRRNPMREGTPRRPGRALPGGPGGNEMGTMRGGQMSDEQRARVQQALQQRQRRGINENYARELMELHTLGVNGGGYTQQDIIEVAKAFTGWTIQQPRRGGGFEFDERRHVKGPKTVLGKKIDKGGVQDGEAVLDLLAAHPSTATFIATKLTRRFVSDDPPKALVERAAAKFRSTNGNLREVVRTILTSPEFTSADAMRAKVKTPFEFVASALRATGATIEDGTVLVRNLQGLGMPLYMAQPPTGYIDRADVWVNTGALLNRMNFAVALVNNRLRGVRVDLTPITGRNPPEVAAARDAIVASLLSNDVSESTRATIAKGSEVTQVAALTLGSPEFQRR
jgi:uncharacterized protein (DUF1800 family)